MAKGNRIPEETRKKTSMELIVRNNLHGRLSQ
jgi:hypothetical protein